MQYGEDLFQKLAGRPTDMPDGTSPKTDRFDLLDHDKAGNVGIIGDGDVKRETAIGPGQRTNDRKSGVSVKEIVAHHYHASLPTGLLQESER
ncbi:MAG: hypothetical protein A2Z34_02730 [Planctomycetes bacterium RBG_16_59_8]|nr:MAG: hypothetical protein A2Z34_02730 [Planctomycetes bacterium RBG_16_59_8]